jgi:hypothetical protein
VYFSSLSDLVTSSELRPVVVIIMLPIALGLLNYLVKFIELCQGVRTLQKDKSLFEIEKKVTFEQKKENEETKQKLAIELHNISLEREGLKQIALQRQQGCPWLEDEYERLFAIRDFKFERCVGFHAPKAAEKIKLANQKRREAERNERVYKNLIEYYEKEYPFLVEYKKEIIEVENTENFEPYSELELQDEAVKYLSVSEYRKLTSAERNQLALTRYISKNHSLAEIGKIYERFIGYEYERNGWNVSFKGILDGFEDLGRDLICIKGKTAHIIQCKNWSHFKTIHEKHIFQLFGTLYQYRKQILATNKYSKVLGVFCTTTQVSSLAHEFAKDLGIEIRENKKLIKDYPCIKCNISANKEKIYHLPFDQQYDRVKIEPQKGEFYCQTIKEAEARGFRRAFRHVNLH